MEIEADRHATDRELIDQNTADEVFRRESSQCRIEPQHDGAVEVGAGEQAQLGALVGEAEERRLGPEDAAWMRLESHRRRRPAERAGARKRRRDHGAVTAVHAVEIADGDDGAGERRNNGRIAVQHDEGAARLRMLRQRRAVDRRAVHGGRLEHFERPGNRFSSENATGRRRGP